MKSSSKKIAAVVVSLASVALATWVFFSPHMSVKALRTAVEENDVDTISSYVDFPALRENLIASKSASNLTKFKNSSGPLDAMEGMLGMAMAKSMMESLLTPGTFATLMKFDKRFENAVSGGQNKSDTVDITMGYKNFSTFQVSMKEKGSADLPFKLTFKRHGLLTWKLSNVNLSEVEEAKETASIDAAAGDAAAAVEAAAADAAVDAAAIDAAATVDAATDATAAIAAAATLDSLPAIHAQEIGEMYLDARFDLRNHGFLPDAQADAGIFNMTVVNDKAACGNAGCSIPWRGHGLTFCVGVQVNDNQPQYNWKVTGVSSCDTSAATPPSESPSSASLDQYSDGDGVTYIATQTNDGFVFESSSEKIYIGNSCDAFSKKRGSGTWGWANGGVSVKFKTSSVGFPRQQFPFEDGRCPM